MMTTTALPLFDLPQLHAMTGNDPDLARDVIGIFLSQLDLWAADLNANHPPERWADTAHTLKGASLGIGALRLASVCAEAERLGRRQPPPDPSERQAVQYALSRVIAGTRSAISSVYGQ